MARAQRFAHAAAVPLVVGVSAMMIHLVMAMAAGFTPFGPHARGFGDYGPQYLPFHLYLRDVLTGEAHGDLFFTWSMGGGTSFLPEYATYLGGPLSPLVVLFPRAQMDLALLVISLLRIALASAAMTVLLQVLRPLAPRLPAALLALGYGCSAWVVQLGMDTPQWLEGLLAFPVMCLAAIWTIRTRAILGPVLLIAWGWWGNFYTAIMASLGAGLFLAAWLAATGAAPLLRGLASFAIRGLIAVALGAWALVPSYLAIQDSSNGPYSAPTLGLTNTAASLFGFTHGLVAHPLLFAGSLLLVLVPAVLMAPHLTRRARLTWTFLAAFCLVSFHLWPVVALFNGGDEPNGNPYRWSFVIVGLLIIIGWHAICGPETGQDIPGTPVATIAPYPATPWLTLPQLVVGGLALLAVMVWLTLNSDLLGRRVIGPWWVAPVLVTVLLGAHVVLRERFQRTTQALITLTVVLELSLAAIAIAHPMRTNYGLSHPYANTAGQEAIRAEQLRHVTGWPTHRGSGMVQVAPWWDEPNLGLRNRLPSLGGYSTSLITDVERSMRELGVPTGYRRVFVTPGVLAAAVLAVKTQWDPKTGRVISRPAMPMVRTVNRHEGRTGWHLLFNGPVVSLPTQLTLGWSDGQPLEDLPGRQARSRVGKTITMTAVCRRGQVSLHLPNLGGKAVWVKAGGRRSIHKADDAIVDRIGQTGKPVTVQWVSNSGPTTALVSASCIDYPALDREIADTVVPQITVDDDTISATFVAPQRGSVIIATAYQRGWQCSADGRRVPVKSMMGLLGADVDGATMISCHFRQPGLVTGTLISLVALLLVGLASWAFLPATVFEHAAWVLDRLKGVPRQPPQSTIVERS